MSTQQTAFERNYVNARATFQRISDARILHGWTERMEGYGVVVRASLQTPLFVGDRFAFRLSGRTGDALFTGTLRSVESEDAAALISLAAASGQGAFLDLAEQYYSFDIEGSVQIVKPLTDARFCREHGSCVIDGNLEAAIKDVSERGMGIVAQEALRTGSIVDTTIYAGNGVVEVKAEVRYCRKIGDNPLTYRIGLKFQEFDRVNASRWNMVLLRAA